MTGYGRLRLRLAAVVMVMVAVMMTATAGLRAQEEPIEARLERLAGVPPSAAREFFTALRRGLANGDKAAVCALVAYPLAQPKGTVASPAECVARYDDIFTIGVRRAVGKALFDELFVAPDALIFNFGEVWAAPCRGAGCDGTRLRITQVNHEEDGTLKPPQGKLLLSCVLAGPTEGQWLRLTADGNGGAELGLWPNEAFPNPRKMPPQVTRTGTANAARTPDCAFRAWSFPGSPVSYGVISNLSCLGGDDQVIPPMGAIGQLTRISAARGTEIVWCIE